MAIKYTKTKFTKYKPRRSGINFSNELEKLVKKEITSGIKDLLKNNDLFKGSKDSPFAFPGQGSGKANKQQRVFEERQMEFNIDQMVAEALMRGRHTSGVLKTLFGLVPSLIGR